MITSERYALIPSLKYVIIFSVCSVVYNTVLKESGLLTINVNKAALDR